MPAGPVVPTFPFAPCTPPSNARVLALRSLGTTAPDLIARLVTAPVAMSPARIRPLAANADPPSAMNIAVPARTPDGVALHRRVRSWWALLARLSMVTAPLADRLVGAVGAARASALASRASTGGRPCVSPCLRADEKGAARVHQRATTWGRSERAIGLCSHGGAPLPAQRPARVPTWAPRASNCRASTSRRSSRPFTHAEHR